MTDEINTNTEGGAYIEGEVNTGGGDFVGRDQVTQAAAGSHIAQASHGGTAEINVSAIDQRGQQISGDQYNAARDINISKISEEPPFWRRLSRAYLILAIVLGIIATTAAVLAIPGVSTHVYSLLAPPFAPAAKGETLIVIATFHETGLQGGYHSMTAFSSLTF